MEGGYKAIEEIRAGERVYSREQWDESGVIVAKIVEEVFVRFAGMLLAVGYDVLTPTGLTRLMPIFERTVRESLGNQWDSEFLEYPQAFQGVQKPLPHSKNP